MEIQHNKITEKDKKRLNEIIVKKKLSDISSKYSKHKEYTSEQLIQELKTVLEQASVETLQTLLMGLDNTASVLYTNSWLKFFEDEIKTHRSENDPLHNYTTSLTRLIVEESQRRIQKESLVSAKLHAKNLELERHLKREKTLENRKEDLKKLLADSEMKLKEKSDELENLKVLMSKFMNRSSGIIDNYSKQNDKLKTELEKSRDAIQQVNKATMEALNKAEERRQNLKAAKDAAEKEHQEKVAMLNNQIKDLKAQLTKATDENNANGETNEGLNQKLKGLESELAMVNETLNNAQKALNDAEAEKEQLESKVLETNAQLEEANAKIESLSKENTTVKEQNKDLEEALATAKQEASKNPELLERIKQLETQLKDADGKLLSGNAAKKAIEAQLAAAQTELEDAKTKVDAANAKLKALEEQLQTTSEEKEKLESELAQMKKDHEDNVKKLEALVAEKDKLGKELRKQLDMLKEDSEKTKALSQEEKDKLLTEIADLQKALDEKMAMPEEHKNSEKRAEGQGMARNPEHKEQAPKKQGQLMPNNPTYALPHAGDMVNNPFFTAGAIAIMLSAGTLVMKPKKKEED